MQDLVNEMADITGPEVVEIQIRADGSVIWVNVNGECALRICRIKTLVIDDQRK